MAAELEELRRRFAGLRDEELLRIVTVRRAHYRRVALSLVEEELTRRGVTFAAPAGNLAGVAPPPSTQGQRAQTRGTAFWFGILLIGSLCYWAAGMVDQMAEPEPDLFDLDLVCLLKPSLIVLISLAGGWLMRWWESVD